MKNSKVGMRWVWLWLAVMVLGGGGLGCGNEECKKDDVICANELTTSVEATGDVVWTAPSSQKEDAVWDELYAYEIRFEGTSQDDVYPGAVPGSEKITAPLRRVFPRLGDTRHTLTIYDNEAKRGSHSSTELCLDSTKKQVDCAGWVAARKKKILPGITPGEVSAASGSVRCYGFSIANTLDDPLLDKITWSLRSTTSYQFDIEPGMTLYLPNSSTPPKMEPLQLVASKASTLIGSSPKTITAFDAYSLSLPLGKYSLAGADASHYVRAGWTLGDTTVGCTLLQSRFVEIRAKASPKPLAKNEVLTVLFTQLGWAGEPAGEYGWCYYTSKAGEQKTAKPYRGSTAGAKCEMIN